MKVNKTSSKRKNKWKSQDWELKNHQAAIQTRWMVCSAHPIHDANHAPSPLDWRRRCPDLLQAATMFSAEGKHYAVYHKNSGYMKGVWKTSCSHTRSEPVNQWTLSPMTRLCGRYFSNWTAALWNLTKISKKTFFHVVSLLPIFAHKVGSLLVSK